jgi:hypothetical protein
VGRAVLDHQQQAAVAALVAAELVAQRLEAVMTQSGSVSGARPMMRSRIGLAASPGDGGGADVLDGDRQFPEVARSWTANGWNAPGHPGSLGASRTCPYARPSGV